jgi:hypothetical protein
METSGFSPRPQHGDALGENATAASPMNGDYARVQSHNPFHRARRFAPEQSSSIPSLIPSPRDSRQPRRFLTADERAASVSPLRDPLGRTEDDIISQSSASSDRKRTEHIGQNSRLSDTPPYASQRPASRAYGGGTPGHLTVSPGRHTRN